MCNFSFQKTLKQYDSAQSKAPRLALLQRAIFLVIIVCIFFSPRNAFAECPCTYKTVLIIHSYSSTDKWTTNTKRAITETFAAQAPSVQLRFEYMDSNNFSDKSYLSSLALMYANKYAYEPPDGIITTDYNALHFMETYGADIFPDVPVIATSVNSAKKTFSTFKYSFYYCRTS